MSARTKARMVGALALAGLLGLAVMAVSSIRERSVDREIVLVAEDMSYRLVGDPTPNPTITMTPGEVVRITLENRDPGMAHDLVIEGLRWRIELLERAGTSASAILEAPASPGRYEYVCTPHPLLMRGTIEIVGERR